jgi:methionyl-tRNA formyltransferase
MAAADFNPHSVRVVFMGSPQFAVPSLRALIDAGYFIAGVYTQPDRVAGRGRQLRPPPVKIAALERSLPVFQPERLRGQQLTQELKSLEPDLIVVTAYGQILRPEVLAIPKHGVINVHASLLPRYRGASPVNAAILAGDEVTGVTIMLVDEGLDTGPILAQRSEMILPEDTAATVSDRLAVAGADLLAQTLPAWLRGSLTPVLQDDAQATLTRRLHKEEGRIVWSKPAELLWREVRAYAPWPGSITVIDGVDLQIHQAWPIEGSSGSLPGAVVPLTDSYELPASLPAPAFAVQTGAGLLLPLMLQKSGRKALSAREFLNGERGLIGRLLG